MVTRLMYISRSVVPAERRDLEMRAMVEVAVARNAALSVTGGLVHTGSRFAQVLEGTADAIDQLMASIGNDLRHRDIIVIERSGGADRLFVGWMSLYDGRASYIDRVLERCLAAPDSPAAASRLLDMFRLLSKVGGIAL